MEKITLQELRARGAETQSKKDNSPRGFSCVPTDDIRPGDSVIIDNHFVEVVSDRAFSWEEKAKEAGEDLRVLSIAAESAEKKWLDALDDLNAAKGSENVDVLRAVNHDAYTLFNDILTQKGRASVVAALTANNLYNERAEAVAVWSLQVLNKYDGKRIGDKTREKIGAELSKLSGGLVSRCWFDGCCGHLYELHVCGWRNNQSVDFSFRGKWIDENGYFFDSNGFFRAPAAISYHKNAETVEDPEKRAAEMEQEKRKIEAKREELREMIHAYNRTAAPGIRRIEY